MRKSRIDVPAKVAQGRDPTLRIDDALEEFLEAQTLRLADVKALIPGDKMQRHILFSIREELRLEDSIREVEPHDDCKATSRQPFDDEQNLPRSE